MSVLQASAGRTLLRAPGVPLLYKPLRGAGAVVTGTFAGPYPNAIAGLSGWWDAGAPQSLLDPGGTPLSDFGGAVGSAADKSGAGSPLTVFHAARSGNAPVAAPRVAGLLGGLGHSLVTPPIVPASGQLLPALDPDTGLRLASAQMGAGAPWTRYLVWTRPNFRQGSAGTGQIALLAAGNAVVLAADSTASPARLILFPGASQTVLTTALERRHTHSIILRNTPGAGLDVWLDGSQVAAAAPNPLPPSAANVLLFGHSGAPDGGAQCWFHEAATWEHALDLADIATLLSCATRWPRGARRGIVIVPIGQSNAGNALGDGAWDVLAQGVAWHLGAAAWNVVGNYGSSGSATCVGGHGIYAEPAAGLSGDFVHDPGDGSNPSRWAFGLDGTGVETVIGNAAPDSPDIAALLFPWSETDSVRPYSEAAKWQAAAERLIQLLRARLGKTAPLLPLLWWNPIPFPYGNAGGMQMVRERIAAMHSDPAQNVVIAAPQTADSNQRGATWNPATGIQTGGDSSHRDAPDNIGFGRRMAPVAARAILAAGVADTLTSIPAGIPAVGGPVIASAHLTSPTTVLLTVAHDAGDDLRIPLQAKNGAGFAVMNGGSVASPGPVVSAVACAYVSPTQLQITLAGAVGPASSCLLFYPYGYASIGRGNAVTDNFSSVTKPAGWDIGHDLGSAWTADCPLAATLNPVQMT